MGKSTYYVKKSKTGLYELRQSRFKGRKTEHPHDLCAIARTRKELSAMRKKFNLY